MNRIILIGNGFDLAHKMKTSYNNFIDDYWENEILKMNEKQDKSRYENDMFSITKKPYTWVGENTYENLLINLNIIQSGINFKNKFLEIISSKKGIENWVDIENEYYTQLKNTYLNPQFSVYGRKVVELNDDFNQIKLKLVDYLKQIEHEFNENKGANIYELKKAIGNIIYEPFNLKDFTEASKNSKIEL
ncbi:MAG: AbiH family protein, partial [Flavobacterium sp.]|uniref:AbiH family protein n=1 Tax=Flavobacterium sp. TaxID=239 RepID=UPI003526D1A0